MITRRSLLAAGVIGVPLFGRSADAEEQPPHTAVTPTDVKVIEAALADFSRREVVRVQNRAEQRVILIHQESRPWTTYLAGQVKADFRHQKWSLAEKLIEALGARNPRAIRLDRVAFSKDFRVTDVTKLRDRFGLLYKLPPDAEAFVHLWLPGYSRDGRQAALRFYFGPTAHGATATYLLALEKGEWKVQERAFAFYA